MKKFILHVLSVVILTFAIVALALVAVLCNPAETFDDTYQSVIQKKYDTFMGIEEPKIIIVGGSSAGFGIDEALLEEETGYKVANLGLHAGFGAIIPTELSKANIQEGDIVLLAYEWGWYASGYFDKLGTELVMSGFNDRFDMYAHLPVSLYPRFLGYTFDLARAKLDHTDSGGTYSAGSFDDQGRMILERTKTFTEYASNPEHYGSVDLKNKVIADDVVAYLKDYVAFVESKGASVYFVCCPYYEGAVKCDPEDFQAFKQSAESLIGVDYISDPERYAFPSDLLFDTIYHCNDVGTVVRTELLVQDLENAGII